MIDETVAVEAVLADDVECGPRAYLRPGTHMLDGSKAGTHVEIKKSTIGKGSKVPHLSYIGDTQMGAGVNVGAGSITCNYDGKNKHATTIGDRTFIGSDTMTVVPVNIGADAITGSKAAASPTTCPRARSPSSAAISASSSITPSSGAHACSATPRARGARKPLVASARGVHACDTGPCPLSCFGQAFMANI